MTALVARACRQKHGQGVSYLRAMADMSKFDLDDFYKAQLEERIDTLDQAIERMVQQRDLLRTRLAFLVPDDGFGTIPLDITDGRPSRTVR